MRFSTTTLGCKANQYDTGTIEEILRSRGHRQVKPGSGADVCIVNTCAVTAESVRKSKQAVRRVKKLEPDALIAVCGCFSQLESDSGDSDSGDGTICQLLGADLIGGTGDREGFADEVEKLYKELRIDNGELNNTTSDNYQLSIINYQFESAARGTLRTRALLKIQDGCDNHCAYCIIPKARGHSQSMPPGEIASKAKELSQLGYKEIVLTGIEISAYSPNLTDAAEAVARAAPDARIRLGSLDPNFLTNDAIDKLSKIPNLCEHFHISLQSGCDAVLARMERHYKTGQVTAAIARLRENFGNCGITADLIVGFPGETDEEFEETLMFLEKAAFSAMHIFPYSKRPGTAAAEMPAQVPGGIKKERAKEAAQLAARTSEQFKQAQIGKTLEVLVETSERRGHSRNYLTVAINGEIAKNTLIDVIIKNVKNGVLCGEII